MRQPSPLGQLLVAPQQQLKTPMARQQAVSMPTAPPQGMRYGNIPPGFAHTQRFTGGNVQPQAASQIFPAPDFVAPAYSNIGGTMVNPIAHMLAAAALTAPVHAPLGGFSPQGGGPQPPGPPLAQIFSPGTAGGKSLAQPGQFPTARTAFNPQEPIRTVAPPGSFPTAGTPQSIQSVAAPGQFPIAPRISAASLAAGRRGAYGV